MNTAENRAISPVVGTALLLGIVVILGAVTAGAFTLGLADDLSDPARASTSVQTTGADTSDSGGGASTEGTGGSNDGAGQLVELTHEGGDTLSASNVVIHASESSTTTRLSAVSDTESLTAGDRVHFAPSEVGANPDGDHLVIQLRRGGGTVELGSTDTAAYDTGDGDECSDDDHDRGHGNDCDRHDEDNPGNGPGGPGNGPH
jgi:flagellin-like protein